MNIGYACLTVGVPDTDFKSCIQINACEARLEELISYNLDSLERIIDYNISNDIKLFRISSDLVPFGSSPVNKIPWKDMFSDRFAKTGDRIRTGGIRISMHPGQYTVLNSPDVGVVKRAIADLDYHSKVLDCFGVDEANKIVLHIGGKYSNKKEAISRFLTNYSYLDEKVKRRLVLENDDSIYNIGELLEIGAALDAPIVYDTLHNRINPCDLEKSDAYWIDACKNTWKCRDGKQKIHYSQQNPDKQPGSHSKTISIDEFVRFFDEMGRRDLDIMLEVKDKNLSAVKCINSTSVNKSIKALELEWSRYKYKILESSPATYSEIRKLLKDKCGYPVIDFYHLVEASLQKESDMGNSINAAQHVWGYFKNMATEKEKQGFLKIIAQFQDGKSRDTSIKKYLFRMAVKYQQRYLLDSYYFL